MSTSMAIVMLLVFMTGLNIGVFLGSIYGSEKRDRNAPS